PNTPMFSPKDFEIFWQLILKTNANSDTDPSQAYGIVLHDEKGYTLNFTGNYEDDWGILNNSRPQDDDMREKYNEMFEETFGDYEKTFISYVEEYMLNDNKKFSDFFELYEFDIDENGEISGLTNKYLDDDKIKSDPCE